MIKDFLFCGISSQIKQYVANFDEIISPTDNNFVISGILYLSLYPFILLTKYSGED